MISVFDTNPVVFESTDRILTVSYNGVPVSYTHLDVYKRQT